MTAVDAHGLATPATNAIAGPLPAHPTGSAPVVTGSRGHPVQGSGIPAGAKATVQQFLNTYGLGSLTNWAWNIYTQNGGGSSGIAAITAELPQTPEFKARFPAYEPMAKKGEAMTVQQMLQYEQTAKQVFHTSGIPSGFYDTPQELAKFMENHVDVTELEKRVASAQTALYMTPPDVLAKLQAFDGVDAGHLTAFFLDPDKALPLIQRKYTEAQIGAQGGRAGLDVNATQAEQLAKLGVTDSSAQQGFGNLGLEQGLFQAQTQGENAIGLDQQLAAQFGGDAQAALAFKNRQAQRLAEFQQSSGFATGSQGVGGLGPAKGSTGV